MNRLILSALVCVSLFIFSCTSNKYTVDNLPKEQLNFGNSGGVAGITTTYLLLKNGQLFYKKTSQASWEKQEPQKKKVGKQHFKKAAQIQWSQLPDSEPGNMNYFVLWNSGEEEKTYTWSGKCPDEEMGKWFEALNQLTK